MHESSLAADLIRQIERLAHAQRFGRVLTIHVKVGPWDHFSQSHLRDHFALASQGTVAQGARLEIEPADGEMISTTAGLLLDSLEVED